MNKTQEIYKYFFNSLDDKFKIFIYEDVVAEYTYKICVEDIFVIPRKMIPSDFNYLKKTVNQFEEDYNTRIVNGLFGFKNKSTQINNVSEYISLVVCGHDIAADGIFENFRYQIRKSKYNGSKMEELVIDIEDYIYKESSGLAQAIKILYSNMLNIKHIGTKSFIKGCQYYIYTGLLYLADIAHKKYNNFDDLLLEICNEYELNEEVKTVINYKDLQLIYDATIKILTKIIQLIQNLLEMSKKKDE